MTGSNISKLKAGYPVDGTAVVSAKTEEKQKEMQEVFASMMSQVGAALNKKQDTAESGFSVSVSNQNGCKASDVQGAVSEDRDNRTNGAGADRIKKANDPKNALKEKTADGAKEAGEEVKEIVKEELSVTEEELEEAMGKLGFSVMDLLNPANLAQVVAELTGTEDMSSLLTSGEFLSVMQQCGEVTAKLAAELGISPEDLQEMLSELSESADMTIPAVDEDFGAVVKEVVSDQEPKLAETADRDMTVRNADVPEDETVIREEAEVSKEAGTQKQETFDEGEEGSKEDALTDAKQEPLQGKTQVHTTEHASFDQIAVHAQAQGETVEMNPQPQIGSYAQPVNVTEVISQIAEFVRVSVTSEASSLEMQLNPENLGKVYLHISATKEGNVTAQFAAQSEAVKEALETQLVELRQTLNQQGVKVDAIEVTVATHEFERNLEQNARQEQQQGEQQEKQQGRRSLHLNNLDELSGLMTEEEMLAAKIMQENGNSMDVIA